MSDEKQKFLRTATGTVPKIKHRNNNPQVNQRDYHRNLSNNFDLSWQRQPGRNYYQNHPYQMEGALQEDRRQVDVLPANVPVASNGTSSAASTSGSNSRRESVGTIPKCDNVRKCPDKKQIEDKLNQIREYLQVTTSLMSSIKNNDDQASINERRQFEIMIKDLIDSEKKLLGLLDDPLFEEEVSEVVEENHNVDVAVSEHMQKFSQLIDILTCQQNKFNNLCNTNHGPVEVAPPDNVIETSGYERNELEEKVEFTNRKVQLLKDQQNALINLKIKAENQLREARIAQENLLLMQQSQKLANQMRNGSCEHEQPKNAAEVKQGAVVRAENHYNEEYVQEPYENSQQLFQILDNRDAELNCEHLELQHKFNDIQSKKLQIDQLADQLQNLGDEDDEDIGHQVRKIVTMKQQLSSLKDLLEVVKSTEYSLSELPNVNGINTDHECAPIVHTKKDNIRQEGRSKRNQERRSRSENNAQTNSAEHLAIEKQSNKSLLKMQEQEKVLAELKAKKRELEEIMYKQKDRISMNNDVFSETSINKSDLSTNNVFENVSSWLPAQAPQHGHNYSSDDCPEEDINGYSDINSATDMPQPQPLLNSSYSTSTFGKRDDGFSRRFDGGFNSDYIQHSSPHTSQQCLPSATPVFESRRASSTNPTVESESNRSQVQKQLELIQSVCQSILDQQSSNNVHQLRNNLTPSPRPYVTPNVRPTVPINSGNPMAEPFATPQFNPQYFAMNEVTNNQNMLTANTLQTQAFLLNTLNQCCQMLWFQQREITSLRNLVCGMQNQMITEQPEHDLSQIPTTNPSYLFPNRPISSLSNFRSPTNQRNLTNVKTNQVASACSLPNLNPLGVTANIENAYANLNNVATRLNPLPNARLLETTLNNAVPIHAHHNLGEQSVNNMLGVNTNGQQIWNAPALNNQVAPGNRANNYWDNFRSYSRQNLLSTTTKNNDVIPTSPLTALGINQHPNERPFYFHPTPKQNLGFKELIKTTEENNAAPRRQIHFKSSHNLENLNKPMAAVPPDVLNINHNIGDKVNERQDVPLVDTNERPNRATIIERGDTNYNQESADFLEQFQTSATKSKLFEELRDNIYREVANLISTNVNRPHFLIQLFRDLQQINSDPLRRRTLQSIQQLITNSLLAFDSTRCANRQAANEHQANVEAVNAFFSPQAASLLASGSSATVSQNESSFEGEDLEIGVSQSVLEFLNLHSGDVFDDELAEILKALIIEDNPHVQVMMDSANNLQKCCNDIFNDTWEKFKWKRIEEIKNELTTTISTILMVDFSIMYVIQDHISNVRDNVAASSEDNQHDNSLNLIFPLPTNTFTEEGSTPQMQNGDLAEADQSCIEAQEEEEGAVGGVLQTFIENSYSSNEFIDSSLSLTNGDTVVNTESEVECVEQGLDQVPTRLTTASRSHCNTPNRGD